MSVGLTLNLHYRTIIEHFFRVRFVAHSETPITQPRRVFIWQQADDTARFSHRASLTTELANVSVSTMGVK